MKVLALLISLSNSIAGAAEFKRLHVASAVASSYLKSNWNKYEENYHPNYAFDDDSATAWVEGAPENGERESIEWEVSDLLTVDEIKFRIKNGYQKSEKLFFANSAVKEATLTIIGAREFDTTSKLHLKQQMGFQDFIIRLPANHGLTSFKLAIDSVYPGKVYADTCISDIEIWVKSRVPYAQKFEENKRAVLKAWVRERVRAAKFYASNPASYPFASTSFKRDVNVRFMGEENNKVSYDSIQGQSVPRDLPRKELYLAGLKYLDLLKAKAPSETVGHRYVAAKPVPSFWPDGLDMPQRIYKNYVHFSRGDFALVKTATDEKVLVEQTAYTEHTLSALQERGLENGHTALMFESLQNDKGIEKRGPSSDFQRHLLVYEAKKLKWILNDIPSQNSYLTHLAYSADGRIEKLETFFFQPEFKDEEGEGDYKALTHSYTSWVVK